MNILVILSLLAVAVLGVGGPIVVHVIWCIQMADVTGSAIALLIIGVAVFPVGWVHGVSLILGYGGWVG